MEYPAKLLIGLQAALEKFDWVADKDNAVNAKADGTIRVYKYVPIKIKMHKAWEDQVQATVDISLDSDDQVTFFPKVVIFATLEIGAIEKQPVQYEVVTDAAVSMLDLDGEAVKNIAKAAKQLDSIIITYMNKAYYDYADAHKKEILYYQQQIKEFRTP